MDRLSLRQFIVITFLIGLAMKMFNLPVLMLRFCGRDAFVVLLIEAAADFILLGAVIAIIVCARGKTLFMLLEDAFGAIVSRIITIAVGLFWLLKLFIMLVDVRIFFPANLGIGICRLMASWKEMMVSERCKPNGCNLSWMILNMWWLFCAYILINMS